MRDKLSRGRGPLVDDGLSKGQRRPRPSSETVLHRWRFWENARGDRVIADEIDALLAEDALSIHAQMIIVRQDGQRAARHLLEDIYEVEVQASRPLVQALRPWNNQRARPKRSPFQHHATAG